MDALTEELTRAKIRNINAMADKTELKNEITRGDMVMREAVEKVWNENVMKVKQKLLGIPARAAVQCAMVPERQVEATLKLLVNEALQEMSEYDAGQIAVASERVRRSK